MLLIPQPLHSANDAYNSIIAARQDAYDQLLASGRYKPFVYPWDTIAAALLFFAILLIPRVPTRHRLLLKTAAAIWIFHFGIQTMLKARTLGLANGYGIGLICAWGMIMTITLLFCNDIGEDMRRLEWRDRDLQGPTTSNGTLNGSATGAKKIGDETARQRRVYGVDGPAVSVNATDSTKPATKPYILVWQSYPTSIPHCMEWTADLMTTFRGVGWNWRIATCPPLDVPVQEPESKLKPRNTASISSAESTTVSQPALRQLQLTALRDFAVHYLLLDLLKTIMITDPYFMGVSELSSPSPWPFLTSSLIPTTFKWLLTRFTRLLISICGVISALTFIFSLSPLSAGLLTALVPTRYIRMITRSPILEPSLYPPYWQPLATIANGGLAAFWGKWWHQLFRFGISEPSRTLIESFGLNRKGTAARLLQVGIAFALSGFIHASASFTTFSASKPLTGPLAFFLLQGFGIILQQQLTSATKTYLPSIYRSSRLQKKTGNIGFVLLWLYLTGPLLADDFARCGIWLFEPVPISPLRGLIWADWWVWKNLSTWVAWHRGDVWYKSGLAIY